MKALNEKTAKAIYDEIQSGRLINFPMHSQFDSGDKSILEDRPGYYSTPPAVAGTTTNIWSNAEWLTFDGSSNFIQDKSEETRALMDLEALAGVGHLLIMFDLFISALPNGGSEYMVSHSISGSQGGFGLTMSSGGNNLNLKERVKGGSSNDTLFGLDLSALLNTRISLLYHFNMYDAAYSATGYLNGTLTNSAPLTSPYGAMDAAAGLVIGAKSQSSPINLLNGGTTTPSGGRISNVHIAKGLGDKASLVPQIALDFKNYTHDFLPGLKAFCND